MWETFYENKFKTLFGVTLLGSSVFTSVCRGESEFVNIGEEGNRLRKGKDASHVASCSKDWQTTWSIVERPDYG